MGRIIEAKERFCRFNPGSQDLSTDLANFREMDADDSLNYALVAKIENETKGDLQKAVLSALKEISQIGMTDNENNIINFRI